jgi:hypothetical protein
MRALGRRLGARALGSRDLWVLKAANPDWVDANARARTNEDMWRASTPSPIY